MLSLIRSGGAAGVRLGGAGLQFVATILIARALGVSEAGVFFFWSTIIRSFGKVAAFGFDQLSLQQVPRLGGKTSALADFLAPIRSISVVIALVISLGLCAYAFLLQGETARPLWWYSLPILGIGGMALCLINGAAMIGLGRPVLGVFYRNTSASLIFVVALLLGQSILDSDRTLLCFSAAFVIAGVGALFGQGLREAKPFYKLPSGEDLRRDLGLGLPICLASIFGSVTYFVPLAILEQLYPSQEVAFLTTAYRIYMLFEVLAMAAYSLTMPDLSRGGQNDDFGRMWKIYRGAITKVGTLMVLPLGVAYVGAEWVMGIFGEEFRGAANVLRVLLIFRIVRLVLGPASYLLLMIGKTQRIAVYSLSRLAVTVAMASFLVPSIGTVGMAITLGVGMLFETTLCLGDFLRESKRARA